MVSLGAARAWGAAAPALPPLSLPAPLTGNAAVTGSATAAVALAAAERAHDLGLPSLAADLYRDILGTPGADPTAVSLALATALLDAGRATEAEPALEAIPEPRGAAWRLRSGLAALLLRKRSEAQAHWDAIKAEEVPEADRAWYAFFTGALYDTATPRDERRANQFYVQAELSAPTEIARARFQLAGEQVRLRLFNRPSDDALKQTRETAERFRGSVVGYNAARYHAVMLAAAGQTSEAVESLQRVLVAIPAQERASRDELRFMLGLIGDRGRGGAGRNALQQLLESGQKPERQRQALQLLAEASRAEPLRKAFQADLDKLIAARPPHPILESLWFTRAQFALGDKDYARAEADAGALLREFPLSALRLHVLGVLTQSAWEQQRYRLAADYARRARNDVAGGAAAQMSARVRIDLGVLEAEASFRAGDFRNAAEALAAVLRDRRAELEPQRISELMFLRVLAEIRAASSEAPRVLDELARDPAFEVTGRWQAEWELARALQLQGGAGAKEALARVQALLAAPEAERGSLPPDLRARMMWLHAQLAFDNGEAEPTVRLVDALLAASLDVDAKLKDEIASRAMLLKVRAEFAQKAEAAALATLERVRVGYAKTDAAASSYLIEAEHYAAQDKIGEARRALIGLTDNADYRAGPYAPYALYRLALLSERLGSEENLKEANRRIEELIEVTEKSGGDHELVFAARLKQGEIFTTRNDLPAAQRAYEYLVNNYARRPDVVYAQLALAKCHNAQSATDPDRVHTNSARLLFEQLRDRVDAPLDVRVEAGYNLGGILLREGRIAEAVLVWWRDVVVAFPIDTAKPVEQGATRLYWIARTLCDVGEACEKLGRWDEAKRSYQLVLEKKLPYGDAIARARLQQLGMEPGKTGP